MKHLFIFVLGVATGLALRSLPLLHFPEFSYSSKPRLAYYYETKKPTALVGGGGGLLLGTLPIGTPVLADEPLDPKLEVGWWAFVPVLFGGTGSEAERLLQERAAWDRLQGNGLISARPPEEVVPQ